MEPAQRHELAVRRRLVFARVLLLLFSALAYLRFPDDVVWQHIRDWPRNRYWEHAAFGLAAALIAVGLWLTRSNPSWNSSRKGWKATRPLSELLHAVGLGALFPLPGFFLFIGGEMCLAIYAGVRRGRSLRGVSFSSSSAEPLLTERTIRYCALASMLLFAITLNDQLAEELFGFTGLLFLLWAARLWIPTLAI